MSTEVSLYEEANSLIEQIATVSRHSYFQIKHFIIMKEPTHQARLWRCIKELEVRVQSLKALKMEIEDVLDNRKLIEIGIKRLETVDEPNPNAVIPADDPLYIEEKAIQIRKRQRQLLATNDQITSLNKKVKETEEEAGVFLNAFKILHNKEALKPYDDIESQTAMWNEKIAQEFDLRGLLGLPIDLELAKTTLALENNTPIKQKFISKLQEIRGMQNKIELKSSAKQLEEYD